MLRVSGAPEVRLIIPLLLAGASAALAAVATLPGARPHDPVVVSTALLGGLEDADPDHYRLYALRDGAAVAVPFQIDARDRRGGYELGEATHRFDDNDELVFMAKDLGARQPAACLPAGPAVELEVADPETGARGWAYLVRDPAGPQPARPAYATYDTARNEVRATYYRLRYPPGRNFFTSMEATDAAGRGGTLVARMTMRIEPTFSLLFTRWSPRLTEDSFTTVITGVREGPVRSIVRARQALDLGRLLPDAPAGDVLTLYYFSSFVTPSRFEVPGVALQLLRDFRFEGTAVLDDGAAERYVDAAHPEGIALATAGEADAARDTDWYVVDGPAGAYLHALDIPEEWRRWGITRGTVRERTPDGRAAAGYTLRDMTRLRHGGAYDLNVSMVILPQPYRPGDEAPALAMLQRPLEVRVRRLDAGDSVSSATTNAGCASPRG
jgi:hypothetical protein